MNNSFLEAENKELLIEAMQRMRSSIDDARSEGMEEANVATLSTANLNSAPSSRSILIEDINDYGPFFFANFTSGKGIQMASNPYISLCLYLRAQRLQIIVEGRVSAVSDVEAESIWLKRDRHLQVASWASNQSGISRGSESHEQRLKEIRENYSYEHVPLPENWRGYRVSPNRVEFWKANWRNIKDRQCYVLKNNRWKLVELEP